MQEYNYILSFHIISVLSWMAVLFYMPRLFVYHQENLDKQDFVDIVEKQEKILYKAIGLPAKIATIISGGVLLYIHPFLLYQDWMIAKLIILVFLIIFSFSLEYFRKKLYKNHYFRDGHFFRAYNEVPTIFAILIVVFVITKSIPIYFSIAISLFFMFIMYKIVNKRK
jgi:putative membrane protein